MGLGLVWLGRVCGGAEAAPCRGPVEKTVKHHFFFLDHPRDPGFGMEDSRKEVFFTNTCKSRCESTRTCAMRIQHRTGHAAGSVFCPPYQANLSSEQTWIKKMIHFRLKFLKIGAQSGIVLPLMGDRGCGGLLGGNANITNTPPHVRGSVWGSRGHPPLPEALV